MGKAKRDEKGSIVCFNWDFLFERELKPEEVGGLYNCELNPWFSWFFGRACVVGFVGVYLR